MVPQARLALRREKVVVAAVIPPRAVPQEEQVAALAAREPQERADALDVVREGGLRGAAATARAAPLRRVAEGREAVAAGRVHDGGAEAAGLRRTQRQGEGA